MLKLFKKITLLVCVFCSFQSFAGYVVVVNADNDSALSRDEISDLFLGKDRTFPNGIPAQPVRQKNDSPARKAFVEIILRKSESQIRAFWSKKVFTGKGRPPKELSEDAEVLDYVASTKSGIGYIDENAVSTGVRVVAKF